MLSGGLVLETGDRPDLTEGFGEYGVIYHLLDTI